MLDVSFFVALTPHAQGRPRAAVVAGRADVYKPSEDRRHESAFALLAGSSRPVDDAGAQVTIAEPVVLDVVVVQPRPASLSARSKRTGLPLKAPGRRWATARPDLDNLQKSVLDALKHWWSDDALVVGVRAFKVIAALGEAPGYHVRIRAASAWRAFVQVEDCDAK